MPKRKIEVFTAGCPVCDKTVKLVKCCKTGPISAQALKAAGVGRS